MGSYELFNSFNPMSPKTKKKSNFIFPTKYHSRIFCPDYSPPSHLVLQVCVVPREHVDLLEEVALRVLHGGQLRLQVAGVGPVLGADVLELKVII